MLLCSDSMFKEEQTLKLGVLVAFDKEIDLLNLNGKEFRLGGCRMCSLTLGDTEVVLALCGIGKANAGACTQLLISDQHVDAVLNIGLAGSACHIPIGGAVLVTEATYHDLYPIDFVAEDYPTLTSFPADKRLFDIAEKILSDMGVVYTKGIVATGDQFISNSETKQDIISRTNCSAVEMEGCAIAHIAAKNDIPFCLVKIISDSADEEAEDQFHDTLTIAEYLDTSTNFIKRFAQAL